MSLFPRSFIQEASPATSSSFHPLFRLLDDFDNYRTTTNPNETRTGSSSSRHNMKTFTPKFDVKEIGDVYELHGDLPGIAQKDIEIEFSDENTITIKGRTERSHESGTRPGVLEAGKQPAAIEGRKDKEHQPTVEDEDEGTTGREVAKASNKPEEPQARFWVSERSVGEFTRSFTFPVRVSQDDVKASMKNGVLSIMVPKAKKTEARKITIQ